MKRQILSFVLILAGSASARIIHVSDDYTTIQAGIDASVNGDTVLVAPGTYNEVLVIDGKNILLSSASGPDTTIIRGNCRFEGRTDSTCCIKGLTFIDNGGSSSLIMVGQDNSPKIEGNILLGVFWVSAGGNIACWGGNPIIKNNIIKNGFANFIGGGICFENSSAPYTSHAEISYNIISNNRASASWASGHGGGIYLLGDAIIKYNVIYANEAYCAYVSGGTGGGIYRAGSSESHKTVISNNTIVKNSARFLGNPSIAGGIDITLTSPLDTLIMENNIIAFNLPGGNIRSYFGDSVYCLWDYNLIYGDTISTFPHGERDIFLDPQFVDTLNNDFHLLAFSPCIDAGDPSSPLDPDSTRADIGALFYDQSVGIDDESSPSGPYAFELHQNYPNPFNAQTTIAYNLPVASPVSLRIYDLTGRIVRKLIRDEHQSAGFHHLIWDGADESGRPVATAIYLYELKVGEQKQVKAMIVIR